jgi:hypothetical protein
MIPDDLAKAGGAIEKAVKKYARALARYGPVEFEVAGPEGYHICVSGDYPRASMSPPRRNGNVQRLHGQLHGR